MEWRNVTLQVQLLKFCDLVQFKYIYKKSGVVQGGSHMTPLLIISVYAVFMQTKWPINARSIILPGHVYHWLSFLPNISLFYFTFTFMMHLLEKSTVKETQFPLLCPSMSFYFQDTWSFSSSVCIAAHMYVLPQFLLCRSDNVTVFLKGLNISLPQGLWFHTCIHHYDVPKQTYDISYLT